MHDATRNMAWAIVVADERRPEWVPHSALELKSVPVQYCRLGESVPGGRPNSPIRGRGKLLHLT